MNQPSDAIPPFTDSGQCVSPPISWAGRIASFLQRRPLSPLTVIMIVAGTLMVLHIKNPAVGRWFGAWESQFYVHNVTQPLQQPIDSHFGYRLFPALIVRFLPLPIPLAFQVCAYASPLLAACLLYQILRSE